MSLKELLRRYLRTYPEWRFAPPRVQVHRPLKRIGSDYGGYLLDAREIGRDAVIYSLGVGEDISFDLEMMRQFGVTIHALDPTPKVRSWLASQVLPEEFHFYALGVGDFDGESVFYLPPRPDFVSHSIVRARQYSRNSIRVPIVRLSTIMRRLGHSRIDVLKMDIEGAEYAVIRDLVRERIVVEQILVEFHHRLSSVGTGETKQALSLLEAYGMKIGYVCPRMEVFTLLRMP